MSPLCQVYESGILPYPYVCIGPTLITLLALGATNLNAERDTHSSYFSSALSFTKSQSATLVHGVLTIKED